MPDNKAFWDWAKDTYGVDVVNKARAGFRLPSYWPGEVPPEWQSQYQYWQKYIQPQPLAGLSPIDYESQAITALQRAVDREEITYEEYQQGLGEIQDALSKIGVAQIKEINKEWKALDAEGNVIENLPPIPTTAPFYREAATLQPKWAYDVQQRQYKEQQKAYEQYQKEQQAVKEEGKKQQKEVDVATVKEINKQNVEQFNQPLEQAQEEAKLRAAAPNIMRQAGGQTDVTNGVLTAEIQKARQAGIDTSQAEATLGTYTNNELRQTRAYTDLHSQLSAITLGQQEQQGRTLQSQYPSFWNQYQDTLAGLKPTGNERPEAFPEWLKGNQEFQTMITQQKTETDAWKNLSRRAKQTTRI